MRPFLYLWLALLLAATPVAGQQEADLVKVSVAVDQIQLELPMQQRGVFVLTITDESGDDLSRAGQPSVGASGHIVRFEISLATGDQRGWIIEEPSGFPSIAGSQRTVEIAVTPTPAIADRIIQLNVTVTITGQFGSDSKTLLLRVETLGLDSMSVAAGSLGDPMRPREIREATVKVTNNAVFPRMFHMEAQDKQGCGLTLLPSNDLPILPRTTVEMPLSVRAPGDKPFYFSEDCPISITISDAGDSSLVTNTAMSATINGPHWKPEWSFAILAVLVPLVLLVWFARRRTQIIEEELLGKPQRPWTIPVERVYLEHLEAKDPRAAYVVRHYLMEEEYASSLLWYKHYKQGTRGERAKETLVVRQEKKYDRFKRSWAKRIAAPMRDADKFDARLQKKLNRGSNGQVRKDRRAWKKIVAKLETAIEAQNAKSLAKWEKAAAKADKKSLPAPPKPELLSPDLPPEPQLQKIHVADHKWNKKATKFRKKMVKRQGNLEVKFEKKDARMLHKLRKKVHKIARKLDDPEFVNEHPLLAKGA